MPALAGSRPAPAPGVDSLPLDDELVLFDPRSGAAFMLNPSGAFAWGLCDGGHALEEIASEMAQKFGIPPEVALRDVEHLVALARARGLLAAG